MMKKFKITWDARISECDDYGDELGHYFTQRSQIVEGETEDEAFAKWKAEHPEDAERGAQDCIEIVEHELFKKHLLIDMPDGMTYGVPVEVIARHRAEYYAHKEYDGDVAESLRDDTLPLFESDDYEIHNWAANNMNWSEVKGQAIMLKKKVPEDDFQDAWCNAEYKIA